MDPRREYFWNVLTPSVWIKLCLVALIYTLLCIGLASIYHWTLPYYTPKGLFGLVPSTIICFALSSIGLTNIAMGLQKVRLTHIPWYMQGYVVQGIANIALVVLIPVLGLNSVVDSDAVSTVGIICVALIVVAYIWSFIAPTKKYQQKESEQARGEQDAGVQ